MKYILLFLLICPYCFGEINPSMLKQESKTSYYLAANFLDRSIYDLGAKHLNVCAVQNKDYLDLQYLNYEIQYNQAKKTRGAIAAEYCDRALVSLNNIVCSPFISSSDAIDAKYLQSKISKYKENIDARDKKWKETAFQIQIEISKERELARENAMNKKNDSGV